MIKINLLPEAMRRKDGRAPSRFLIFAAGIVALGLLGYAVLRSRSEIQSLEMRVRSREAAKRELQARANELKEIADEVARLAGHVDAVKELYRRRIIWARILSDVKEVVDFDQEAGRYNAGMRHLWLQSLKGDGDSLIVAGFAAAGDRISSMRMPERLLQSFLDYVPLEPPEKGEEKRLNEELRRVIAENEVLRRGNPDSPLRSARETGLRKRLAEIGEMSSGGIALRPFSSFFAPGSLRLVQAAWIDLPRPLRAGGGQAAVQEQFPSKACNFKIKMEFKRHMDF